MAIQNKALGKFTVNQVANGFVMSVMNPDYKPGQDKNGSYVLATYIADDLEALSKHMVAYIVTEKLDGKQQ